MGDHTERLVEYMPTESHLWLSTYNKAVMDTKNLKKLIFINCELSSWNIGGGVKFVVPIAYQRVSLRLVVYHRVS